MDDILSRFSINCHSSIRYAGAMTVWFDPFRVADAPCDADVVFVTHDHYDHFSPEDIHRVMKPDAVLVLHGSSGIPHPMVREAIAAGISKVNLATEIKDTFMRLLKGVLTASDEIDLRKVFPKAVEPVTALLEEKYRMTGTARR